MTSGGRLEAWHFWWTAVQVYGSHTSKHPPDVILRRSFTRPSTALAMIEGLGTRLQIAYLLSHSLVTRPCVFIASSTKFAQAWERGYFSAIHKPRFSTHTGFSPKEANVEEVLVISYWSFWVTVPPVSVPLPKSSAQIVHHFQCYKFQTRTQLTVSLSSFWALSKQIRFAGGRFWWFEFDQQIVSCRQPTKKWSMLGAGGLGLGQRI